jgi:hypothetical protein
MCDTFRPLFPTKAAIELDDANYPKSWEGEHFPGLASGKIHVNGEAALPKGNGEAAHPLPASTNRVTVHEHKTVANVWAP